VTLHSKDVIHSFFLPEFRVKQDAVPGMTTRIWLEATRVGQWEIACAELCGLGHFRMKGFVTVETPEEFERWLAETAKEASS
jgi:cytochrome c oxidase subunit 2